MNENEIIEQKKIQNAHDKFMGRTEEFKKLSIDEKLELYFSDLEKDQLFTLDELEKAYAGVNVPVIDRRKPAKDITKNRINLRSRKVKVVSSDGKTISTFDNRDVLNLYKRSVDVSKMKEEEKKSVDNNVKSSERIDGGLEAHENRRFK